jgi:hypothetical protein
MTIPRWLLGHPFTLAGGVFFFAVFWAIGAGALPMDGIGRILMAPAYLAWIASALLAGAVASLPGAQSWGGNVLLPLAVYLGMFWSLDLLLALARRSYAGDSGAERAR